MKLKKTILALLALLLIPVMSASTLEQMQPVTVQAVSSSEIQDEIDELEKERDKVQEEMKSITADLKDNMSEIDRIAAEKGVIDQEIALLNREIVLINDQILAYGLLIAEKQEELDVATARLEELTQQNKQRIRTMEEDGELSYWSVLFRANSFSDLLDRLNMIEEIASADRRRLEEMRVAQEQVAVAQEALAVEKLALEGVRLELQEKQTLMEAKVLEAEKKLRELKDKNEIFLAKLEEAEAADYELMKEIAQKEKEYNEQKAKEEEAARPPATVGGRPPASVTNGITWVMPCAYNRVSSPFGWRIHPVYGYRKFHAGIDLANSTGTPIYATRSGTVTVAKYSSSAGYYVTINHGDGFSSVYMHMTHYIVGVGDTVSAGQKIGEMGSTGVSTGSHLHFAISYQGEYQNPADYLNFG